MTTASDVPRVHLHIGDQRLADGSAGMHEYVTGGPATATKIPAGLGCAIPSRMFVHEDVIGAGRSETHGHGGSAWAS